MTTVLCSEAERDLILAGARHLVVPGEQQFVDSGLRAPEWPKVGWRSMVPLHQAGAAVVHDDGRIDVESFVAPQRWVDATGPCPTCGGSTEMPDDASEGTVHCIYCIDGRKRVALAVPCPHCLNGPPCDHEIESGSHGWGCDKCGLSGVGPFLWHHGVKCENHSVVFAHATVEVLPACWWHDDPFPGDPCIVVYRDRGDQYVVLYRNDTNEQIWLNPLPVPGRDWIVALDNVELAQ